MQPRRLRVMMAVVLLAILCAPALAATRRKAAPRLTWDLSASLATIYNDNLIGLSERDRNQFVRDPLLFPTPLETVDDLENEVQLRPTVRWRAPQKLMLTADYRLRYVKRWRNDFADYWTHTFGLSLRPRVADSRWNLRFRVAAIPSFYLRDYKDRDYNAYHSTRYSNWDYETAFRYHVVAPFWLEASAGYGSYYYNRKFTEYDSEFREVAGALGYDTGRWRVNGSYTRRHSENIGKDQREPFIVDPDRFSDTEYGDSDYNEDEFGVGLHGPISFVKWRPTKLTLIYKLRRRVYTTDRSLESDPFHRGRLDKRGQFTTSLSCEVNRKTEVQLFMTYDARGVDSPVPQVPLAKDFVRHEFGVQVERTLR
ncbi:hypothetical protein HZB60_05240 [candidate division KSB1 bacterium]|nr:hypothetical protein [candidate division KSB1 bacterium]